MTEPTSGVRTKVASACELSKQGCRYFEEYVELVTHFDSILQTYERTEDFTSSRGAVTPIWRVAAFAEAPSARWVRRGDRKFEASAYPVLEARYSPGTITRTPSILFP